MSGDDAAAPAGGPRLIHSRAEMQQLVRALRAAGRTIGLVPTMGALHEGHLSLSRAARAACDVSVATIFVNPTQFGPKEDFSRYPRTLPGDLKLLEGAADFVFAPSADEMYPRGFSTYVEPPAVAAPLEGALRPGHFRGVCTVVLKLFEIVPADVAFFGRKDYQQALVIQRMAADFNLPLRIEVMPTVREPDGLALSSRNRYLTADERKTALGLSRALATVRRAAERGERSIAALEAALQRTLAEAGITNLDYAVVRDGQTLAELTELRPPAVALLAVRVGGTRLIDNEVIA